MYSIHTRFTELINAYTNPNTRFKDLERLSGISSVSWRKAHKGDQRPTVEMLEVIAQEWPHHAYWLASGDTDNKYGHTSPSRSNVLDVAYEAHPASELVLKLRGKLSRLLVEEKLTLRDRWEDWLTDHQEKYSKKYPWFYSVHPSLVKRKEQKEVAAKQKEEAIAELIKEIVKAMHMRDSELAIINDSQKD